MLKHVLKNGNTTTYEWRTGTKPEKVDLTKIVIDTTDEQDPVVTDSVDVRVLNKMIILMTLGLPPPLPKGNTTIEMGHNFYRARLSVRDVHWPCCGEGEIERHYFSRPTSHTNIKKNYYWY